MRASWPLLLTLLLAPRPAGQTPPAPDPGPGEEARAQPGLFPLGPFWVTPRLRVGTLGVDTNVFYTSTDRQTDLVASGGPGLEVALPGRTARLLVAGNLDYLFFARTKSQRRLTGDARARGELRARSVRVGLEEAYAQRFDRPSAEVDERVQRGGWSTRADLELDLGHRFGAQTALETTREDVVGRPTFGGARLDATLSRDTRRVLLGLSYRATGKTTLLAESELREDSFPLAPTRDTRGARLAGGFRLESRTRLEAHLLAGRRFLRPADGAALPSEQRTYLDAQLAWHFGPRTQLRLELLRDVGFSAFDAQGRLPLLDQTRLGLGLERSLRRGRALSVFARRLSLTTQTPLSVVSADGTLQTAPRDDRTHEAGVSVTQLFRSHWRAGVTAGWSSRNSVFDDLGVAGLLLGGTLTYVP